MGQRISRRDVLKSLGMGVAASSVLRVIPLQAAEHAQRQAENAPPPPVVAPCPPVMREEVVSREVYWRTGADEYDDSQSHPLRIIAYIIHPVGYTLEWLVTRPFHELVAQPDLEPISGHDAHAYYGESPFGVSGARSTDSVYH